MRELYCAVSPKYREGIDVMKVEQGLAVDINDALKTGIVRDTGAPMDSNGIDDPGSIIGRVENTFDAIEAARAIRKHGKKAKVSPTPSSPSVPDNANPSGD